MSEKCEEAVEKLSSLRKTFLRHLSESSNISEVSAEFGRLKTNLNRVDFVLDLLDKCKIEVVFQNDGKNNDEAENLRREGNEFFKVKKVKEAWEMYTKSIGKSEKDSVGLGLAYANRSAVLFEVGLYQECLQDIDRAIACNYPPNLKNKLLLRADKAKNSLQPIKPRIHEPIPLIIDANSKIQCASDCFEIKTDDDMGRHIVSIRDIEVGEILAVEKPFAFVIVNHTLNHCHECLSLCYNLIPCDFCAQTMYCDENCKELAYRNYHKFECDILLTLKALEFDKLKILPMKIALIVSASNNHQKKEILNNYSSGDDNDCYYSERYKEIGELVTNIEKRSVSDLFERATNSAIIFNLLEKNSEEFSKGVDKDLFKETILLHMQTGPSNFHEITELAKMKESHIYIPEEVGSGAFSFLSLLNHSCSPNVARFCYGTTIVLRAIEKIKKGEQCFDNYGYHHALSGREDRKKQLKDQYYFDCICEACTNNWDLYENLEFFENGPKIDEKTFEKLSLGDVSTALENLDDLIEELNSANEKYKLSKNLCNLKEIVKQCFAVFGSKRELF